MIRLVGLFFISVLAAFLFIYGIGIFWFAFSQFFFPSQFENFRALDIEGRLIERFSFFFTFLAAFFIAHKYKLLFSYSKSGITQKFYTSLEMSMVMSLSVILGFSLTFIFGLMTIDVESILFTSFTSIIYQFFIIAIVNNFMVSLGEEMVYRGVIFIYLYKKTANLHTSLVMSALVFSILHFNYTQPLSFLLAFTGGWIFAYSYHYTKTLCVPVGMHFSYNFFMEIFQSEDQNYLEKILESDVVYLDGIGDWFAVFRFLFLWLVALYIYRKYGLAQK